MPKRKFIPTNALEALGEACGHSRKSLRRAVAQPITDDDAYLMRKVKARIEPSESQSQRALIKIWSMSCRAMGFDERMLMAFPMQGLRTPRNGARMKAEGMRAGLPDLFLAFPNGKYHGLWMELKTTKGKLTESQEQMRDLLMARGYAWCLCRSTDEAICFVREYIHNKIL